MTKASERRQHTRFEVGMELKIANGMRRIPSKVTDVSAGGAKLLWQDTLEPVSNAIKPGQFVELQIEKYILVDALVLRIDDDVLCVRFDVTDDDIPHVTAALSDATGHDLSKD